MAKTNSNDGRGKQKHSKLLLFFSFSLPLPRGFLRRPLRTNSPSCCLRLCNPCRCPGVILVNWRFLDRVCRHPMPLEQLVFEGVGRPADDQGVQRLSEVYVKQLAEVRQGMAETARQRGWTTERSATQPIGPTASLKYRQKT